MIMRTPGAARPQRRKAPGKSRRLPVLPLLIALLLVGAAAAAFLLTRGDDETPGGAAAGEPVQLRGVASFDPQGDNEEHSERVADATDGDPATYWTTERYQAFTKGGVGLVLEVAGGEPSQLAVTTDTPGYTAEIRAGAAAAGPFDEVVGTAKTVTGTTTWELDTDARFLTIWITSLDGVARVNEAKAT